MNSTPPSSVPEDAAPAPPGALPPADASPPAQPAARRRLRHEWHEAPNPADGLFVRLAMIAVGLLLAVLALRLLA